MHSATARTPGLTLAFGTPLKDFTPIHVSPEQLIIYIAASHTSQNLAYVQWCLDNYLIGRQVHLSNRIVGIFDFMSDLIGRQVHLSKHTVMSYE